MDRTNSVRKAAVIIHFAFLLAGKHAPVLVCRFETGPPIQKTEKIHVAGNPQDHPYVAGIVAWSVSRGGQAVA